MDEGGGKKSARQNQSLSVPEPDRITWRLLKALKDIKLGKVVLDDI